MSSQQPPAPGTTDYGHGITSSLPGLGIDPKDLADYAKKVGVDPSEISQLSSAQNIYRDGAFIGTSAPTALGNFNRWLVSRNSTNQQHDEYVKLTQDNPGRQGTILTIPSAKTVLG